MISLALFNNKGGVGKTTLTYHLAHMIHRMGLRVVAVDLDPQSNLTAAFLDDDALESLWQGAGSGAENDRAPATTIAAAVKPIMEGIGDVRPCEPVSIDTDLWLLAGDLPVGAGQPGRSYEVATLRNYQSLMPLAHDARKPMFDLRTADGAIGSTQRLVERCYHDFRSLSEELIRRLLGPGTKGD